QSEGEGVAQLLKAGKYADAAKLVRDAAGRGAGWKPWADGQHQRIRGDWQAYARREADAGRRAAIFDAYLRSYTDDKAVANERDSLLAKAGSREADRLFAALGQSLRDGQADKAAGTLAELQKLSLANADRQRRDSLASLVTQ